MGRAGLEPDRRRLRRRSGRVVNRAGVQVCGRKSERKRSAGLLHRIGGPAQSRCRGFAEGAVCGRSSFAGTGWPSGPLRICSAARKPPGGRRRTSARRGSPKNRHLLATMVYAQSCRGKARLARSRE